MLGNVCLQKESKLQANSEYIPDAESDGDSGEVNYSFTSFVGFIAKTGKSSQGRAIQSIKTFSK